MLHTLNDLKLNNKALQSKTMWEVVGHLVHIVLIPWVSFCIFLFEIEMEDWNQESDLNICIQFSYKFFINSVFHK